MNDNQHLTTGDSRLARHLGRSGDYYWFLVAYLVCLSALGSFVNDMYTPALPGMCRFFGCSVPVAQMGLATGMTGLALGQLLLGPVSDKYGRKPVLIASASLFVVSAVASVFSPTIHVFNLCRLFQGMGASGGYFLARSIPADVYTGRPLAKLMALIGAINGIAPASAPVIGGFTADAFGWKGIFIVLAGFAALLLALSPVMDESLEPARRSKAGLWQSFGGYKNLIRNRPFIIHICLKGTALGLLFAYISSSPFILQTHYGLSQTSYGLLIGFNAIFVAGGSMAALKFRLLKSAASWGALLVAVGVLCQAVALWTVHSIVLYEVFTLIMLSGLGLIFTSSNTLAMNEGRSQAGEASSLLGISGYAVGAVVTPLVGVGDMLHSTDVVYVALAVTVAVFARLSSSLAADLGK